jgi:hypothetical protein
MKKRALAIILAVIILLLTLVIILYSKNYKPNDLEQEENINVPSSSISNPPAAARQP